MHRQDQPVIWRLLGRWRVYAFSVSMVIGFLIPGIWLALQFHVTDAIALTPATKAFFAGIGLIMLLNVFLAIGSTVSSEQVTIAHGQQILVELHTIKARLARLEALFGTEEPPKC